ncbi:MAG: helix-turn-helix transcriptional regulator [Deltaproteobacteria bacterium]|nr:helix-turn-helix transcriptional regulator [Deltaproteobacteria bacterium]
MIYKTIGKKIQKAREEAGLSQEELASRLGYSQAALSNYELGKRRLYLANIEQIARELNKPLSYFLDESHLPVQEIRKEGNDEILEEIGRLLSELPSEEKKNILEYIKWRRDRLK